VPWSYAPKPTAIPVDPAVRARVVDLARQDRVRAVRLLREETGLPRRFSVALVDSWLTEPAIDVPAQVGERLLDVVRVMDRLRSPGGCPWDAEQTHSSLRGYLLEEAHEAYDAIVDDDPAAMREELGDVLLQVVFHARVAAEASPERRFDIDDVAGDLVDKLVRRHPHLFGDAGPRDVAEVEAGWEEIKKAEKQRLSPTEGVSRSQPAASWGAALVRRAGRAGLPTPEPAELADTSPEALGERLLAVVAAAEQRGWDVEDALREAVRRYAGELDAEAEARSAP
jgi:XTP/dITP diphosphohydrolase